MANKDFDVPGIGIISVYKRAGSRNIRLSVANGGKIRVTIPTWVTYAAGVNFARSKADWIVSHQPAPSQVLTNNQAIGKSHHLFFKASLDSNKPTSRVLRTHVIVTHPLALAPDDASVQKVARAGSLRALRLQAEQLLPIRLQTLARQHGFSYRSVGIRNLKSRWGSCDQDGNITLNLFLMQLPWHLIDYVLLHELTHTRVMRHGPPFWQAMAGAVPDVQQLRREIRSYQTVLS